MGELLRWTAESLLALQEVGALTLDSLCVTVVPLCRFASLYIMSPLYCTQAVCRIHAMQVLCSLSYLGMYCNVLGLQTASTRMAQQYCVI